MGNFDLEYHDIMSNNISWEEWKSIYEVTRIMVNLLAQGDKYLFITMNEANILPKLVKILSVEMDAELKIAIEWSQKNPLLHTNIVMISQGFVMKILLEVFKSRELLLINSIENEIGPYYNILLTEIGLKFLDYTNCSEDNCFNFRYLIACEFLFELLNTMNINKLAILDSSNMKNRLPQNLSGYLSYQLESMDKIIDTPNSFHSKLQQSIQSIPIALKLLSLHMSLGFDLDVDNFESSLCICEKWMAFIILHREKCENQDTALTCINEISITIINILDKISTKDFQKESDYKVIIYHQNVISSILKSFHCFENFSKISNNLNKLVISLLSIQIYTTKGLCIKYNDDLIELSFACFENIFKSVSKQKFELDPSILCVGSVIGLFMSFLYNSHETKAAVMMNYQKKKNHSLIDFFFENSSRKFPDPTIRLMILNIAESLLRYSNVSIGQVPLLFRKRIEILSILGNHIESIITKGDASWKYYKDCNIESFALSLYTDSLCDCILLSNNVSLPFQLPDLLNELMKSDCNIMVIGSVIRLITRLSILDFSENDFGKGKLIVHLMDSKIIASLLKLCISSDCLAKRLILITLRCMVYKSAQCKSLLKQELKKKSKAEYEVLISFSPLYLILN